MKRFAVSSLAAVCGLLLTTTAHASFVEKSLPSDPEWKTQEEVDAEAEARIDARTAVPSDSVEQRMEIHEEEESDFNDTDSGDEIEFGGNIRFEALDLSPSAPVTRAEFTAMLVRARYGKASIDWCYWDITSVWPPKFELLFRDVPVEHEFAPEICVAMRDGLVRGYGNDVFRPDAQITFADAAKMIARSEGLTPWADASTPKHWFAPYVEALAARNAIPLTVQTIEERITGGEAMEIMDRLIEDDRSKPSRTAAQLVSDWEKKYAPRPRPVVTRPSVPARPSSMGPVNNPASSSSRSSSSAKSSVQLIPTVSSVSSTPIASQSSTSAMTSASSSRPKAWYEF